MIFIISGLKCVVDVFSVFSNALCSGTVHPQNVSKLKKVIYFTLIFVLYARKDKDTATTIFVSIQGVTTNCGRRISLLFEEISRNVTRKSCTER